MEREAIYRIYRIVNDATGLCYIGCTKLSLKARFQQHCSAAFNWRSATPKTPLGRAIREFGKKHFRIEELDRDSSRREALYKEKLYVKKYDSFLAGYNGTSSAGAFGAI